MKTKFFLSILLSLITISASAYDWMVDGIAYNRNSDGKTVTVTSGEGFGKTTGSLIIPEKITLGNITFTVTAIANRAFYYCSGLTDVTIGNSVTSIGKEAFYYCSGLTEVTIGNSVTSIGDNAFYYCSGLTSVIIGNSVTSIGKSAFLFCDKLKNVYISSLESWCKINFGGLNSNPLSNAHNLYMNGSLVTDLVIPNSVTSIGNYAFGGCSRLNSVTIPNTVTSIGSLAFWGCSRLTSVTIGNSVTSIGSSAFKGCSVLTSVTIPNSVTSIDESAFSDCSSLTSVTIGNSVTSIGSSTFSGCSGLKTLTIPNSVTSIGSDAFSGCSSLTSVTIPNSVTSIGDNAFNDCSGLKKVDISSLESWCKINFNDRDSNPLYYAHNLYLNGSLVTDLVIPNTVTSIGSLAFNGCSGLTSVTIPNSVTTIGEDAFRDCSGFTGSLNIPNSVTSIGSSAFNGCSGLTSVTIGNSVTNIGGYAFGECYSLMEIHSKIKQPGKGITYGSSIFYKAPKGSILLFIPKGTKTLYNNTSPWNQFINIVEEDDSGINDIKVDATPIEDVYYNLHGQRVFNPTPGIYIHNGKKELVR